MSALQQLETGSRHDLRVEKSPDAPDGVYSRTTQKAPGYYRSGLRQYDGLL
jgi:hypothetical protein